MDTINSLRTMKIIENLIISVNIKINAILLLHDLGDGDIFQKEKNKC